MVMMSICFKQMKRVIGGAGLVGLLMLILFHGCTRKEYEITVPYITPSVEELKANASGGIFTIDIQSNVNWNIVGEFPDWYDLSKIDDHTLSVVIDENTTAQDRKTSILIEGQGLKVKIPITQ